MSCVVINCRSGREVDSSVPHTLLSYCRQIATGLYYLSRKGFVHRDIAARNILLSEDHEICKASNLCYVNSYIAATTKQCMVLYGMSFLIWNL